MNRKPKRQKKELKIAEKIELLGETERIPTDEDVIEIVTGIETPEPCEEYESIDKNMRQNSTSITAL